MKMATDTFDGHDVLVDKNTGEMFSDADLTDVADAMMNINTGDRYDTAMKYQTAVGNLTTQQFELAGFFIQQESVYRVMSNMESVIWAERSIPQDHLDDVADRLNRIREKQVARRSFHEMGLDKTPDDESEESDGRHSDAVESDGPFTVKPKLLIQRVDDPLMNARRWLGIYDETIARGAISYRSKQPFSFEEAYSIRVGYKKADLDKVLSQRAQDQRAELIGKLTGKMSEKVVNLWKKTDQASQQRYDDFCERLEDACCRALDIAPLYETPEDWDLYWLGDDGDVKGIWNKATDALTNNTRKTGDESLSDLLELGEIEAGV